LSSIPTMEDEELAAVKSLNAQVVQLQGALAQAGTDLTLAKVQQVSKSFQGKEQMTIEYMSNQLWHIQTELNALRKFQAFSETREWAEVTLQKNEVLNHLGDIIEMRVQSANQFNPGVETNLAKQKDEKNEHLNTIQELECQIEHFKVDMEYETKQNAQLEERNHELHAKIDRLTVELGDAEKRAKASEQMGKHKLIEATKDTTKDIKGKGGIEPIPPRTRQLMDALRQEARTKDIALLYAHFEIRKEQKKREFCEEKSRQSIEKLQKMMILCDKQRRELKIEKAKVTKKEKQEREERMRPPNSVSRSDSRSRPASLPRNPSRTRNDSRVGTPRSAR